MGLATVSDYRHRVASYCNNFITWVNLGSIPFVTVVMTATVPSCATRPGAARHLPIIYYGTTTPARERTRRLRDVAVVLQLYHPLCQSGAFADYFPNARRFVYFNPTAATPPLTDPKVQAATLGYDATWNLERLDLRRAAARRFATAQGLSALTVAGAHGLFVDDLDRWDHPAGRCHARAVLRAVASEHPQPPAWFFNRGFGFWKRMPCLTGALLESLTPYQVDRMGPSDLTWVTRVVLPALRHARAAGMELHCLTYDHAAVGWQPHGAAALALATLTGQPLFAGRDLDQWPATLTEER